MSNQRPSSVIEFKNKEAKKGIYIDNNKICDACKYNEIKKKDRLERKRKKTF